MGRSKANLVKSLFGFFIAAMCIMYPQQIGGLAAKGLGMFGDLFSKIITPIFLKVIGVN